MGNRTRGGPLLLAALSAVALCLQTTGRAAAPSPEHPVGWRGDGTGRYPDATPPTQWQRLARTPLTDFRTSAAKPADAAGPGDAPPLTRARGAFHPAAWLVLGPLSPDDPAKASETELLPGEANLSPAAGQAAGGAAWKAANVGAPVKDLDLLEVFGVAGKPEKERMQNRAAYLCAYVFAEAAEAGMKLDGDRGDGKFWLNGKAANTWEGERHKFVKGWNRIVVKLVRRGRIDHWTFDLALFPVDGPDLSYETKGFVWTTEMPGPSFSMPILVGDKLFVTSEPSDLLCVEKATGKILWVRSDTLWHGVTGNAAAGEPRDAALDALRPGAEKLEAMNAALIKGDTIPADAKPDPNAAPAARARWQYEQRRNFLDARRKLAQDLTDGVKKANRKYGVGFGWGGGNAVPTPCSDGRFVYTWHGETGVLSCYDLDGKPQYVRFQHAGSGGEHGINASPALVGDKIVVLAGQKWLAFDKRTGSLLWTQKYLHPCYASCLPAKIGGADVLVAPDGQVVRAADGAVLSKPFGPYDGECASPVFDGERPDTFYLIARGGFCAARLAAKPDDAPAAAVVTKLRPMQLQEWETYPVGSPISDRGLIYATHSGWGPRPYPVLLVIDPFAGRGPGRDGVAGVVYEQPLDMSPSIHYAPDGAGVAASLALAGNYLYCLDNRGETVVFEPGRAFKQVTRNVIEDWQGPGREEVTNGTPVFEGRRMYLRGSHNLYCVGE